MDDGLALFTAWNRAKGMDLEEPGSLLEVGAYDLDFSKTGRKLWPDVKWVGIDQRRTNPTFEDGVYHFGGNVLDRGLFPAFNFDAAVAVSAIEHVGLGHYGDPLDEDGDIKAMQNVRDWLRPGAWFYLDVPFDPTGYRVKNKTYCRIYDWEALRVRILPGFELVSNVFAHSFKPGKLIKEPTLAPLRLAGGKRDFYYIAMLLRRAG